MRSRETMQKSRIDWHVITAVQKRRVMLGLSQEKVANHLAVSTGFISHVESPRFRAKYNMAHLNELAKLLGCAPKEFLPLRPLKVV